MKRFFFWMIVVGIVVGASAAGYSKFHGAKQDADSLYRTMKVRRGEIRCVVNSSGTVQPVHERAGRRVRFRPDHEGQRGLQRQGRRRHRFSRWSIS